MPTAAPPPRRPRGTSPRGPQVATARPGDIRAYVRQDNRNRAGTGQTGSGPADGPARIAHHLLKSLSMFRY
jgi:hypothetical protein